MHAASGEGLLRKSGLWRAEVTMSGIQRRNDAHYRLPQKERISSKLSRAVLGIMKGTKDKRESWNKRKKKANRLWREKGE